MDYKTLKVLTPFCNGDPVMIRHAEWLASRVKPSFRVKILGLWLELTESLKAETPFALDKQYSIANRYEHYEGVDDQLRHIESVYPLPNDFK